MISSQSRTMEEGGEAGGASHGDEKEGGGSGASRHAHQHEQPDDDVHEARTVKGGGGAVCASHGDKFEGAGSGASRHAHQHGQPDVDVFQSGQLKEAEELKVQVMETRKRVLEVELPDTLTSMSNLAHP